MSHGFSFVESGYNGPSYPRVKGMRKKVDGSGQCVLFIETLVLLLSTVSRCGSVLARLTGDPVLTRQYRS